MSQKLEEKALKYYQKGEKHLASGKYKKCESEFAKAIEFFMKAEQIERAEKVNLKLCECFIIEKKFYEAAKAAATAAELILRHKKYKNAIKHYQSVIDFYEKVDASLEILEIYCLIILCYLAQGKFQEAVSLLKKKIAKSPFPQIKKNKLIQLTIKMVNTILKKDPVALEEIELQVSKLKLEEGLRVLVNTIRELISYYVQTLITIQISNDELRAGDETVVSVQVKKPTNLKIINCELGYDRVFDLVEDKQFTSDRTGLTFKLRPRIQGTHKIGPISLTCQVGEFQFPLRIQKTIEVLPGKPGLNVELETEEIITQVNVPVLLQLNLKNTGKGECLNISFTLNFPEELSLVEGHQEKRLHSLGANEAFLFSFRIVAHEPIQTEITATITYDDLEGHSNVLQLPPIPFQANT
ncbi:MAG: hypothetical protein ACTSRS_02015 [Candidatus Helarchaeota archaeon]